MHRRAGAGAASAEHAEPQSPGPLEPATRLWFGASEKLPRRYGSAEAAPAPTHLVRAVNRGTSAPRSFPFAFPFGPSATIDQIGPEGRKGRVLDCSGRCHSGEDGVGGGALPGPVSSGEISSKR